MWYIRQNIGMLLIIMFVPVIMGNGTMDVFVFMLFKKQKLEFLAYVFFISRN